MAWMKSKSMDKGLLWAIYAASLVHDYQHGGLNNDFLIKTAHPLAITYSDDSPLEHHHLAAATRVFFDPECMYLLVSHTHMHVAQPAHSSLMSPSSQVANKASASCVTSLPCVLIILGYTF